MMEIHWRKPENISDERRAELKRLATYMRTGNLPDLKCPRCNSVQIEPLTMDGYLCHGCKKVFVKEKE